MRKGKWKLLTTFPGAHPWQDSAPPGIEQYPPGGRYPNNNSAVFVPETNDTVPTMHQINSTLGVFLFDIEADPTETFNKAASEPAVLQDMLATYSQYAASAVVYVSECRCDSFYCFFYLLPSPLFFFFF